LSMGSSEEILGGEILLKNVKIKERLRGFTLTQSTRYVVLVSENHSGSKHAYRQITNKKNEEKRKIVDFEARKK